MALSILARHADPLLMVGGFVFAVTLLPTLRNPDSAVPSTTSVPTAAVLSLFAATYLSLSLPMAALSTALSAVLWTVIAVTRRPEADPLSTLLVEQG